MADKEIREGAPEELPRKGPPDEIGDEPEHRRQPMDDDAFNRKRRNVDRGDDDGSNTPLSAVVPVGVSIWALLSFYLALLSCFVPGLGIVALICGIVAFSSGSKQSSYGSVTGQMRAVLGVVISVLTIAVQLFFLIAILSNRR